MTHFQRLVQSDTTQSPRSNRSKSEIMSEQGLKRVKDIRSTCTLRASTVFLSASSTKSFYSKQTCRTNFPLTNDCDSSTPFKCCHHFSTPAYWSALVGLTRTQHPQGADQDHILTPHFSRRRTEILMLADHYRSPRSLPAGTIGRGRSISQFLGYTMKSLFYRTH